MGSRPSTRCIARRRCSQRGWAPAGRLIHLDDRRGDRAAHGAADRPGSLAEQGFLRAWGALVAGVDPAAVALHETARALAATRLSAIDAEVLCGGGMCPRSADALLRHTVRDIAEDAELVGAEALAQAVAGGSQASDPPAFAVLLCNQPRAGATAPGRPRLVL